jgi:hypothetical protein
MTPNELIQKLIFGEITLSQSMMLSKVLFREHLTEASYKWICDELDNYDNPELMPDYRIVDCSLKAVVFNHFVGTRVETIDTKAFNRLFNGKRERYASPNKMLVRQGIESLEDYLSNATAGASVEMELNYGQVNLLMKYYNVQPGYRVERMYQECSIEQIKLIVSSVKNKLITILQEEVLPSFISPKNSSGTKRGKRVFISYGWDDIQHQEWVKSLAHHLSQYFDVMIDEKVPLGGELNAFMEQQISKADRVILILTPQYKKKADSRENGVGYESVLISSELYRDQGSTKFIPIVRRGTIQESYPRYLGTRKGLMMNDDDLFDNKLAELIEDIQNN